MDVKCTRCGEPLEIDYLHDVAAEQGTTFDAVWAAFRKEGCPGAGFTCSDQPIEDRDTREAIAVLYEVLGDDIDGAASLIEDMEAFDRVWAGR